MAGELEDVEVLEPEDSEGEGLPSEEAAPLSLEERLAKLEEEREEERKRYGEEKANLEDRLRQTHAWGNEANMARVALETMVRSAQSQAPPPEDLRAPEVTQEDLDKLYDDPGRIVGLARDHADYAAKWVLKAVGPAASSALKRAATEEQEFELLSDLSVDRARRHFASRGVDTDADFDQHLPQAWQLLNRAALDPQTGQVNPVALRRLALNPKAIQMAVQSIWDDSGGGQTTTARTTRNPSIGAGKRAAQNAPSTPVRDETIDALERSFKNVLPGFKFTDADLREALAETRRRG